MVAVVVLCFYGENIGKNLKENRWIEIQDLKFESKV